MATYVATDLHGNYEIWKAIQEYLKEDDTLIYLGDAIDRGDRGWEIFTELLEDERVVYIKGNHEDMMYQALTLTGKEAKKALSHWKLNGGIETLENMNKVNPTPKEKAFYLNQIKNMLDCYVYTNAAGEVFFLTHAGCTPDDKYFSLSPAESEKSNLWNRDHIYDEWPHDQKQVYIVHGHTPVQLCIQNKQFIEGIVREWPLIYNYGHKINLDIGTAFSKLAVLYNLDTNSIECAFKGV